jgi:flagellar protein FliS
MMNPYFEQKVMNADPVELIQLLHQKALGCVREARNHLQHGRIADRSRVIGAGYSVIAELLASLRPEVAPDLTGRLQGLYLYMQRLLLEANFAQTDPPLAEVLSLLSTLAEGWNGVLLQSGSHVEATDVTVGPKRAEAPVKGSRKGQPVYAGMVSA